MINRKYTFWLINSEGLFRHTDKPGLAGTVTQKSNECGDKWIYKAVIQDDRGEPMLKPVTPVRKCQISD